MRVSWFNAEHYFSPTEHDGMLNVLLEEKQKRYRPLVYICSPYAGDIEKNTENARRYSRYAVDHHAIPVTPHLLYPQFLSEDSERELGLFFGIVLLGKCRELWAFGPQSEGMKNEIFKAEKKGLTIRYFKDEDGAITEVVI